MVDSPYRHEAVRYWTQENNFDLTEAWKKFGLNMKQIETRVPSKNPHEIKAVVDYNKEKRINDPEYKNTVKASASSSRRRQRVPPLEKWQQLLTKSLTHDQLRTETATAVRMIAEFEDIPPPEETNDIDFRKVYHQLANALEGKPITADLKTTAVLRKCLVETALRSKFNLNIEMRDFLKNLNMADKSYKAPKPDGPSTARSDTVDQELDVLRHFSAQQNYNPLGIPEQLLQMQHPTVEMGKSKNKGKGKKGKKTRH